MRDGTNLQTELDLLTAYDARRQRRPQRESALEAAIEWLDPLELAAKFQLQAMERKAARAIAQMQTMPEKEKSRLAEEIERTRNEAYSLDRLHEQIAPYAKEGVKTAALFLRGPGGVVATITSCALDECRLKDKPQEKAIDFTLGCLKGAGLRLAFSRWGELDPAMKLIPIKYNLPAQAALMGAASRAVDAGLSRSTWVDPQRQAFDAGRGLNILGAQVLSPRFWGADVMAWGLSAGLVRGARRITGGATERNPVLATALLGGGLGICSGGAAELSDEQRNHDGLNPLKIAGRALCQGAVDAAAAVPGGVQADRAAMRIFRGMHITDEPSWKPGSAAGPLPRGTETLARCCNGLADGEPSLPYSITPAPAEPPERLWQRVRQVTRATEQITECQAAENEKFADYSDFYRRAIRSVDQPVRRYQVEGHTTELMVPESYARQLDQIREHRLHGTKTRELFNYPDGFLQSALPEDFIPHLDGLPNSRLVKRINILNQDDPDTPWLRQKKKDPFWSTAANASPEMVLNFFRQSRFHDGLRENLNHEWAHLLHFHLPEQMRAFDLAALQERALEPEGFNARSYALTNNNENWAVHLGEEILAYDGNRFLKTAASAPLRSAVLARALKLSLADRMQPQISLYRTQFLNRADFIERNVTAPAAAKLERELVNSDNPRAEQIELLDYLSNGCSLKLLRHLAPKVRSAPAARAVVEAGARQLASKPDEAFRFLYDLADPGLFTHGEAIDQITGRDDFTWRYISRLGQLEALNPQMNRSLHSRYRNLAIGLSASEKYDKAEPIWRKVLDQDRRIFGGDDRRTAESELQLALSLSGQNKHAESWAHLKHSMDVLTRPCAPPFTEQSVAASGVAEGVKPLLSMCRQLVSPPLDLLEQVRAKLAPVDSEAAAALQRGIDELAAGRRRQGQTP